MGHALVDRYDSPEQAIAAMNRRRSMKTVAVLGGLVLAIGVMIAAAAAMYSDGPAGVRSVPAQHK